jgi:hypothetical protein
MCCLVKSYLHKDQWTYGVILASLMLKHADRVAVVRLLKQEAGFKDGVY